MKTSLPTRLNTAEEAKSWIEELIDNKEDFHFDDPADDIVIGSTGERLFTDEEAEKVQELVDQCFDLLDDPHEHAFNYSLVVNYPKNL